MLQPELVVSSGASREGLASLLRGRWSSLRRARARGGCSRFFHEGEVLGAGDEACGEGEGSEVDVVAGGLVVEGEGR